VRVATTDPVHALWEALVAIANQAGGPVALVTGRTTANLVPWADVGTQPLPGLVGQLVGAPEVGGVGENYRVTFRFSAVAQGNGATRTVRELVHQWRQALTQPALAARNVDAAPLRWVRDEPAEAPEDTRALARHDVTVELWLTA
jgi:hypothetical protein